MTLLKLCAMCLVVKGVQTMAEYVKVNKVTSYIKGYAQRSIDLGSFDLVDDILTICENIEKMSVADVVSRETHEALQKALIAFAETDVAQVVRCKDCKRGGYHKGKYYCSVLGGHSADWFCAYGERKDNENL